MEIGPLQDPVTWHKITYTGEQVAQWDFQNNVHAFVLEVPLCNFLTSICNFLPCDRVLQRAYLLAISQRFIFDKSWFKEASLSAYVRWVLSAHILGWEFDKQLGNN